jgi:hypothetical protein
VGIFALQLLLSISIIIWTSSPGTYPSFSKWIVTDVIPWLRQQQDVISAWDFLNCEVTILVYLNVIYLP